MKYYIEMITSNGIKTIIVESKNEINKKNLSSILKERYNSNIAIISMEKCIDSKLISGVYV